MSHRRFSGFTLIELMITTAVIGILLAIATPQYSAYVLRAKYTEALDQLSGLKSAVMKYAIEHEGFSALPGGTISGTTLEEAFHIQASDGVGYLLQLKGRKQNSNQYRLYQYVDRTKIGAPNDAPDMLALYIRYLPRNGMLTTQCRYYRSGKGWAYAEGQKYVPTECRN